MRENFPGDHMSGAFDADAVETAPAPVRQGGVYTGNIAFLKGLEVKRTRDRIFFEISGEAPPTILDKHFAKIVLLMLIQACLVLPERLQGIKTSFDLMDIIFLLVAVVVGSYIPIWALCCAKRFFIIDFKENLCGILFHMSKAPLIKMQNNQYITLIRKDVFEGVTVDYKLDAKSKGPSVRVSAPALLSKNGILVPLTDYKAGDDYAARADDSAKIVSKLWNLPYYKCPKKF